MCVCVWVCDKLLYYAGPSKGLSNQPQNEGSDSAGKQHGRMYILVPFAIVKLESYWTSGNSQSFFRPLPTSTPWLQIVSGRSIGRKLRFVSLGGGQTDHNVIGV